MKNSSCCSLNDLNVLVVEDDKCTQEIYKIFLARVGVRHSDVFDNAEQAISAPIHLKSYGLIISDYELGKGMNGLQLFKFIRERDGIDTPFFIISSVAHDTNFLKECEANSVTHILPKPVSLECFQEIIGEVAS